MAGKRGGNKWQRPHRPVTGRMESQRADVGPDGHDYYVRQVSAARATKTYRCPGCDQEIRAGIAHVVVWPAGPGESGIEDRRHWHSSCWKNRANRGPTRRWS